MKAKPLPWTILLASAAVACRLLVGSQPSTDVRSPVLVTPSPPRPSTTVTLTQIHTLTNTIAPPSRIPTRTPTPTPTDMPTRVKATLTVDPSSPCTTTLERRELREPYQRYGGQARYTLSIEELNAYLAAMGLVEFCIPPEFGAPFINVDWNSTRGPADIGRMISLGFEDLNPAAAGAKRSSCTRPMTWLSAQCMIPMPGQRTAMR